MSDNITILLVTVLGMVIPIVKLMIDNKKLRVAKSVLEQDVKDRSMHLQVELESFNSIRSTIEALMAESKADRFLILTATNGFTDMKFATAIYEQHAENKHVMLSMGASGKYVRFEFDSEYKMLKDAEKYNVVSLNVHKMPASDLKDIYETEKVHHAEIFYLHRAQIDDQNDRIFYCSVCTHDEKPFTKRERTMFKARIDSIKPFINTNNNL